MLLDSGDSGVEQHGKVEFCSLDLVILEELVNAGEEGLAVIGQLLHVDQFRKLFC